jgi:hypothetical protein
MRLGVKPHNNGPAALRVPLGGGHLFWWCFRRFQSDVIIYICDINTSKDISRQRFILTFFLPGEYRRTLKAKNKKANSIQLLAKRNLAMRNRIWARFQLSSRISLGF